MNAIDTKLVELKRRLVRADRHNEAMDLKRMIAALEALKARKARVAQVFAASDEIAF